MSAYFTTLTAIGQARLANALALSIPLTLTQIAVGDAVGVPVTESQTNLGHEVYRGALTRLEPDTSNPNWTVAEMVIPTDVGGWTVREVGLYDDAGNLIAYGNFPDSYKPILAEGSAKELAVRMYLETSAAGAGAITLKVDPTVVIASRTWVTQQIDAVRGVLRPSHYFLSQI